MGRKISTRTTTKVSTTNDSDTSTHNRDVINREDILKGWGIRHNPKKFETVADSAQKIAIELFLNQSAICLHLQQRYMDRESMLLPKEEFMILKQLADVLRHLTAFDIGVDINRAWEHLERQGYKITAETDTD